MVAGGRELIDTLWNVNIYDKKNWSFDTGINRYIMECKFFSNCVTKSISRINRYIMECKSDRLPRMPPACPN